MKPAWLDLTLQDLVIDSYSTLASLIELAEMAPVLDATNQSLTVFAPNNEAFVQLGEITLGFLQSAQGRIFLVQILEYHIAMQGPHPSSSFDQDVTLETLHGESIEVLPQNNDQGGAGIVVRGGSNQATIIFGSADQLAENGLMHEISTVLRPASFQRWLL